jgi:hypothetical protein
MDQLRRPGSPLFERNQKVETLDRHFGPDGGHLQHQGPLREAVQRQVHIHFSQIRELS